MKDENKFWTSGSEPISQHLFEDFINDIYPHMAEMEFVGIKSQKSLICSCASPLESTITATGYLVISVINK